VLRVATNVWRDESRRAFAVALAGARAQALATDMGDGVTALTLDAFVRRVNSGRIELRESDVIAVDEAGQIDTRRWAAFTQAVGERATVVALGDHAQLSSIAAGGLWPLMAQTGPKLTEVRRTRLAWERQAWAHLRKGEAQQGLSLYARRGNVDISDTRTDALERAVTAWDTDGRDGLIITDASNAERHRANAAAQQRRVDRGDIGRAAVAARTAQGSVAFHAGDRIIFTAQHQDDTMGRRVENGTTGDIVAVDRAAHTLRVRTHEAKPREIALQLGHGSSCPLDLFYAAHVYKSQGATVRRAYVVAGGWQTNRESLYVAASRSRQGTRIFVDRATLDRSVDADVLAELARRGAQSRAKVAATALRSPQVTDLPARFVAASRKRTERRKQRRAAVAAARDAERRSFSFLPGHGPVWVPWSQLPGTPDSAHEVPRHGWR
jgi:ATP-dependent exoDNAse (exonuclease V) alpha subunit